MNAHEPCKYERDIGQLVLKIDAMIEDKGEILEKIDCLEKKLLDPDNGLFARVKENTLFRKSAKRWLYTIGGGIIGLILREISKVFKGGI